MTMGTILYIGFFSLPDKNAAAHRVWNNAKIFKRLGHEVVFLDEQQECYDELLHTEQAIDGFTVYSRQRPTSIKQYIKRMTDIEPISLLIDKYDVDMLIAYNYPSIALIRLMRRYGSKLKICADCTEWYTGKGRPFPMNWLVEADSFFRMRIINPHLDGIICISKYLYNYYKNKTNCVQVPPLVDRDDPVWHQKAAKNTTDCVQLICFDSPVKSTEKETIIPIIEAVLETDRAVKLKVVGITQSQFCSKYKYDSIDTLKERVEFLGHIPYSESIRHLSEADYLVIWREQNRVNTAGFSTKFVESVTVGTPVITTDTGELRKYISEYALGYIVKSGSDIIDIITSIKSERLGNKTEIFDFQNYNSIFYEWSSRD